MFRQTLTLGWHRNRTSRRTRALSAHSCSPDAVALSVPTRVLCVLLCDSPLLSPIPEASARSDATEVEGECETEAESLPLSTTPSSSIIKELSPLPTAPTRPDVVVHSVAAYDVSSDLNP